MTPTDRVHDTLSVLADALSAWRARSIYTADLMRALGNYVNACCDAAIANHYARDHEETIR